MMKLAVIDDSAQDIEMIKAYFDHNWSFRIEYYQNTVMFPIHELQGFDAILLDVDMPEENGILFAKRIRMADTDKKIIFISWHDSFEHESFSVHPYSYIHKQHLKEELTACIHDLTRQFIQKGQSFRYKDKRYLTKDIMYFEVNKNDCILHFTNGKIEMIRISLVEIESMQLKGFVKVNRSVIVNIHKVLKRHKSYELELNDGTFLNISRGNRERVKKCYEEFLLGDDDNAVI